MQKPYLVYRCNFKKNGTTDGIDSLLKFEYMGSAEYEFGALPKSLTKIIGRVDEMDIFKTGHEKNDGQGLFVLCLESEYLEYNGYIDELVSSKYENLKERIDLKENINGTINEYSKSDVFWDIKNHVIFCFGKDNMRKIVKGIYSLKKRKESK